MDIQPSNLAWKDAYKLMVGSILPRPIALVSSINKEGVANIAPFSFFTAISAEPMLVCFSPMRRGTDGSKKDTLLNIESTKEFVINIVSEEIVEQMNNTATEYPSEVDEFVESGFTKEPSSIVAPPRVKESLVQMECSLHEVLHFGDVPGSGSLVIGKVESFHISDDLYFDGKIDTKKLNPVGRMAGSMYTRAISDMFELQRK
ncbi:flavin reductase family protein [Sutcliffiella horikoshii]|uniref:Flavin reductase family protein n=1 Tax=Sutcliffiella horikoshii TaxID=79883 RepID=A0A5D4SPB8_9BACI|nr:flavin reductase family protein [Sutcliffiella horikoshii]TYS63646.1 flavin reductase family protein [Sutcliffiella horikoshii]